MVRTVQEPQNTPGRPRLSWGAITSLVRSPSSSQAPRPGGTSMLLSSSKSGSSSSQGTTAARPRAVLGERSENVPPDQHQPEASKAGRTLKASRISKIASPATGAARETPFTTYSSSQMMQMPRTPLVGASPIRRKFQTTPHPRFSLPNIEVDENQTMLLDMSLSDLARASSGFDTESEADDVPVYRPTGRAVRGGVHMTPEPSQEQPAAASSPPQSTPRAKQQTMQPQPSARLPTPPSSQPGSFASPTRLVASRTRPRPQDTPPRRTTLGLTTPAAVSDPSPNPRQKKSARLSEMPSISTLRRSATPIDRVQVVLTPRVSLPKSKVSKSSAKAGPGPSTLSQQLAHSPSSSSTPKASSSTRLPPATAPAASRKPRASQASASQRSTTLKKRSPPQTARSKPRASQTSPKTRRKSTGTRRTSLEGSKRGRKSATPSALKGIKLGVGKKVVPAEPGEDPLLLVGWEADCSIWVPGNDEDEHEPVDDENDDEGDMIPPELRRPIAPVDPQASIPIAQSVSSPRPPPQKEHEALAGQETFEEPQWGFQDDYGFGSDSDGEDADLGNDTFSHIAVRQAERPQEVSVQTMPSPPPEEPAEIVEPMRTSTPVARSTTPAQSPVARSTTPADSPIIAVRSISPQPDSHVEEQDEQPEEAFSVHVMPPTAEQELVAIERHAETQALGAVQAAEMLPREEVVSPVDDDERLEDRAQQDESFSSETIDVSVQSESVGLVDEVDEEQSATEESANQPNPAVVDDDEEDWPTTPEEPNMLDLVMSIPHSPPATMIATMSFPPPVEAALPATAGSPAIQQSVPSSPVVEAQEAMPVAPAVELDSAADDAAREEEVAMEESGLQTIHKLSRFAQSPLAREISFSGSEGEEDMTASCDVTAEAVSADWEDSVAETAEEVSIDEEDHHAGSDAEESADHGVSVISTEEEELVSAPFSPAPEELVSTPMSPELSRDQHERLDERARSQTLSPRAFIRPRPSLFTLPALASAAEVLASAIVPLTATELPENIEEAVEAPQAIPEVLADQPAPDEQAPAIDEVGHAPEDDVNVFIEQETGIDSDVEEDSVEYLASDNDPRAQDRSASPGSASDDEAEEPSVDADQQVESAQTRAGEGPEDDVDDSYEEGEPIDADAQPVEQNSLAESAKVEANALVEGAHEEVDDPQLDDEKALEDEPSEEVSELVEDPASDMSRSSSPEESDDSSEGASEEDEEDAEDERSVVLEPGKIILSVRMLGTVKVEPTEPEIPKTPTRQARTLSAAITPLQTRATEQHQASPARPSTPMYPRLDTLPVAQPEVSTTPTMTPPRRHVRAAATPAESPSRGATQDTQRPLPEVQPRVERLVAVQIPLQRHQPSKLSKAIEMSPDTTAPASPVSDTRAESVPPTQGDPLTESSLRLLDSVQVVPAGRNLLDEMADAEPGDTSINSIVEVSSMDPRAAARAAAILKLNHAYIEHGVLPDRVNATPKRTPRRKSLHASSRFESIETARTLTKDELLHEAELEIVSTHRGRSRSMSVFSTMTAATSATELPIPGGWVRTPKRKRSRPPQPDRADRAEERLAAAEAQAASTGTGSKPWSVPEWKELEKVFRSERQAWIQEREVKGMPGGLIGWAKRVSIGPSRVIPWDPARVVDRFLREENAAELSGEWSRSVIELRVAALERRIKDKEASVTDRDEGEASPTKKARRTEAVTTPTTPRAAAPLQPNVEPASTIKRMLGFFWGGSSTSGSAVKAGSSGKAPVLPVTAERAQSNPVAVQRSRPTVQSHPSAAINRRPMAAYSSTPTQAPRAPTGPPQRATMLTSSFASTAMSSSTYSSTTLATPAANLYPRASEVALSQRKAALQSLFSARHPLSDSTGSIASVRSQVDEDRSFARSRERGSFGSVKDVVRSFEEGRTLDKVMKGKNQAQSSARVAESRLA